MKTIIVKTQAEFDAAKTKKNVVIEIRSEIGENEVFVFGSNLNGHHYG